ncbi:SDR family oxidoreductase [Bradyrhizobium sp. RDM4]|uniref:SDR family oxidoreductase n=1 Tax=Bradyrhizobium sp. RDM4 TaxID=3378765 RepID=UPI0038FC0AE9
MILEGRTILITGAARGVGLAIAKTCAKDGAELIIADMLVQEGEEAARQLTQEGARCRFVPVDLDNPASINKLAEDIRLREGTLDGLVNNAAIATNVGGLPFEEIDIELWDRVMRVNVRGTWLMTRAMSPLLASGAQVVNLASDTALWGPPRLLAYVSSKGAVISMTRSLARELGPRKIGVVGVAPGIMRNEATDYVPLARHQEYETRRAVPGPQVPEDITDAIAFLLTPGALCLTGQILPVGAGFVLT